MAVRWNRMINRIKYKITRRTWKNLHLNTFWYPKSETNWLEERRQEPTLPRLGWIRSGCLLFGWGYSSSSWSDSSGSRCCCCEILGDASEGTVGWSPLAGCSRWRRARLRWRWYRAKTVAKPTMATRRPPGATKMATIVIDDSGSFAVIWIKT